MHGHESQAHPPLIGIVENVRSLWNVGSIFRSADGAGVGRLLICGFTGHPPRPEISKTALGAEATVPWEYWTSAAEACTHLREQGYEILALETGNGATSVEGCVPAPKTAFVVGNEVEGIREGTLDVCDRRVAIDMQGEKDSLNVAVAFGVAAYSLRRQQA